MNNKLLLEIKRFKEILELPLLNEGIPGAVANFFNKYFPTTTDAVRQLNRVASEAEIDSKVVDDFIRVLDDPDLYDQLTLIDKRNIIRLLSNVPELSDELFQNVLNTFDTNIDELNLAVYNYMNRSENPLSYRQAINELFSVAPELAPLIRKKHGEQFGDFIPPSRTASPSTEIINSSKLANIGNTVWRNFPLVSRNVKTAISILAQQKKGIEVLKKEVDSLFDDVMEGKGSLKMLRRNLENKLATIERIADGGAKKVLEEIDEAYKQLLKEKKISQADYDEWKGNKKKITKTKFWNEFIAPNYEALDEEVDGLGTFFKNGVKALKPVKLAWTKKTKLGMIPYPVLRKEGVQRLFNFIAFNSAQTGADILKRLIKSPPPGQKGSNKWIVETYLRAIGPQLIIPFANAAFWTVWIPGSEFAQASADWLGLDVEWDVFESSFSELLADLWLDNLLDIWNKDPEKDTQIELGDLLPIFRSRLVEMIESFAANDDYKEPSGDGESTTSSTDVTTTTSVNNDTQRPNVDGAKSVAPEDIHQFIKNTNEGLRLTDGKNSYPITLENDVYMVELPDGKIKLSDY